jgi:hypothetical protein
MAEAGRPVAPPPSAPGAGSRHPQAAQAGGSPTAIARTPFGPATGPPGSPGAPSAPGTPQRGIPMAGPPGGAPSQQRPASGPRREPSAHRCRRTARCAGSTGHPATACARCFPDRQHAGWERDVLHPAGFRRASPVGGAAVPFEYRTVLQELVKRGASDLHLKVGRPPALRISGELMPMDVPPLRPEDLRFVAEQLMTPKQIQEFVEHKEADFALGVPGIGRFRVNAYQQRGTIAFAFRTIAFQAQTVEELHLPLSLPTSRCDRAAWCSSPASPAPESPRRWRR